MEPKHCQGLSWVDCYKMIGIYPKSVSYAELYKHTVTRTFFTVIKLSFLDEVIQREKEKQT